MAIARHDIIGEMLHFEFRQYPLQWIHVEEGEATKIVRLVTG